MALDGKATKPTLYDMMDAYFGEEGFGVASNPPTGYCKVTNFYVDPATGKLVVEYEDIPV